ncbi:unnamed protein product [Lathyrus sativus]|nr:unnamed protein product [Lathyrus sativus]
MESLGKEYDLDGNRVNQGLSVYGNKGSTDQHAYIQQLRDGVHNFFATFIEVPSWKEKTNLMQNCFEYQDPNYDCSVKGVPDFNGDGDGISNQAVADSFEDRKLGVSQFVRRFY